MRKWRIVFLSLRGVVWALLLLALVLAGALFSLDHFAPGEPVRAGVESALSRFLERKVTLVSVKWGLAPPGLVGEDLRLFENGGREMAFCHKVRMSLSWRSLRRRKLEVDQVVFLSPKMVLRRDAEGETDLARMIRQIHGSLREGRALGRGPSPIVFHGFSVRSGRVSLEDGRLKDGPLDVSLSVDADGELQEEGGNPTFPFQLKARVESGDASGPLTLTGRLGQGERVRVEAQGLPLSVLVEWAPWLKPWGGNVYLKGEWDLDARAGFADGFLMNVSPTETSSDLSLGGEFHFVSRATSTVALSLTDAGTAARLDVTLSPWSERSAWVVFASSSADLDRLWDHWKKLNPSREAAVPASTEAVASPPAAVSTAAVSVERPSPLPPWRVEARAEVRNALFRGETLENFSARTVRGADGLLVLEDLEAAAFGGSLSAGATFYPRGPEPGAAPRFRLSWVLKDLDVGRFSETFHIKRIFSGVGSSSGVLSGVWPVGDWAKTEGEVEFRVRDGAVWGLPGLVDSLSHLNLTSLFSRRREGGEGGLPFDRAEGRVVLTGGGMFFQEPAIFENRTLQVVFSGAVDLSAQTLDAAIVLHFLTFIGEVVRAVPGLGSILMGGRKSLFPVVVRMTGPLAAPKFEYQAARSLLAPFWTPFHRPPALRRKS